MFSKQLHIKQMWDGQFVAQSEHVHLFFSLNSQELKLLVQAPFYDDPAPDISPGLSEGLWDYEVVELFLLADLGQYLEIELGPHGHYLVYLLSAVRVVERSVEPLHVHCSIQGDVWRGEITIATAALPEMITRVNGYAIHGQGVDRRYLAAAPVTGAIPDFHQPQAFLPLDAVTNWLAS